MIGIVCPDALAAARLRLDSWRRAIAMGNTVVAVPSERAPLAATDLYQVLDTSDVPGGVVNIVTGARDELAPVLAEHDDVDGALVLRHAGGRRDGRARSPRAT